MLSPGVMRAAADQRGVDIIENCEVTGFLRDGNGKVTGVETIARRDPRRKVGMAVAGSTSRVMQRWPA
jgi:glycine/D-amino acid oxidase-like deaminating enzyme